MDYISSWPKCPKCGRTMVKPGNPPGEPYCADCNPEDAPARKAQERERRERDDRINTAILEMVDPWRKEIRELKARVSKLENILNAK